MLLAMATADYTEKVYLIVCVYFISSLQNATDKQTVRKHR